MNVTNPHYIEFLNRITANTQCESNVRENYSGRGMFGKMCHGIVGHDLIDLVETAASMGLTGAAYDTLGRDYIVYWPNPVFSDEALEEWGDEVDPN